MERSYLSERETLHGNTKRVYPFWKVCKVCSLIFPCKDRSQATRKATCGKVCAGTLLGKYPRPELMPNATCTMCGVKFRRPQCHIERVAEPMCSSRCNGKRRGAEWAKHAHKGRAAWTEKSRASFREKMTGPGNPAWKGGVTYRRGKGNYKGARYVRCPPAFLAMARKDGYVMEHRLIVAQAIGRCLTRRETVHHENHKPRDNRLENLALFACNRDHKLYEHHGTPEPLWRGSNPSDMTGLSGA